MDGSVQSPSTGSYFSASFRSSVSHSYLSPKDRFTGMSRLCDRRTQPTSRFTIPIPPNRPYRSPEGERPYLPVRFAQLLMPLHPNGSCRSTRLRNRLHQRLNPVLLHPSHHRENRPPLRYRISRCPTSHKQVTLYRHRLTYPSIQRRQSRQHHKPWQLRAVEPYRLRNLSLHCYRRPQYRTPKQPLHHGSTTAGFNRRFPADLRNSSDLLAHHSMNHVLSRSRSRQWSRGKASCWVLQ